MVYFRTLHRQYQKTRAVLTEDNSIKEQQGQRRGNQSTHQRYVGKGPLLQRSS